MTDAPERIWANYKRANDMYCAYDEPPSGEFDDCRTEYVRADLFYVLQDKIEDCAMYLKPGETPRQRMDRDFGDVQALLQLLEKEKRKNEEKL